MQLIRHIPWLVRVVSLLRQSLLRHSLIIRPCIPDCIIISYLIATPNNYRIIARSGYWKYDHECRKTHQIKRVCGTCYAHEFNLNAFRHEWSYIQYSRRAIDYYIYFIDENKRYSRKFRWTTQQNTSKLGTFVKKNYDRLLDNWTKRYTFHLVGKLLTFFCDQ